MLEKFPHFLHSLPSTFQDSASALKIRVICHEHNKQFEIQNKQHSITEKVNVAVAVPSVGQTVKVQDAVSLFFLASPINTAKLLCLQSLDMRHAAFFDLQSQNQAYF